jgi:hypothetical protein
MKIVRITWKDIYSETGWCDPLEIVCPTFTTIGYLIKDGKFEVMICDTDPEYGTITVFPKGCITNMEIIEDGKGKDIKQKQSGTLQELPVRREPSKKVRKTGKGTAKQ